MGEVTARCKVTGFVTGNISERYMKGLATDVESLLKVRSPVDTLLPQTLCTAYRVTSQPTHAQ